MKAQSAQSRGQSEYITDSIQRLKNRTGRRPALYGAGILLVACFALLMSACASPFTAPSHGSGTPNPTDTSFFGTQTALQAAKTATPHVTVTAVPTITLSVNNCPSMSVNWDSLLGTKAGVNKVQNVTCGPIEGGATAALVSVRYYSSNSRLDVYVYDNLGGTPARRFGVSSLLDGSAQISPANTIMTSESGPNSLVAGVPDLYKEYQWNGSSYAQIMFPGFYPDITHYQAEQSENQVKQGYNTWKTNAYSVVNTMTQKVFHWSGVSLKTVTYSDPRQTYIFNVTNLGVGGGGFTVQLVRLDGNITNIFEVTNVYSTDSSAQITAPTSGAQATSPLTVSGSSVINGSVLGQVILYDDTYTIVGQSNSIPSAGAGGSTGTFSLPITYRLNSGGMQEGVVAFYTSNQSNASITNEVVMVKVFLVG